MNKHSVVSHQEWLEARKALLEKEKELTRLRDDMARQVRELPWERVEKEYTFEGPGGSESLADLFEGRGQLIVYHFMFDPEWTEGCKSCSFMADHYEPAIVHLNQRDVTLVTVARAPLATLEAFKQRMGWRFKWVSSLGSDFNRDYQVSFTPEEIAAQEMTYNYRRQAFPSTEGPGLSVFCRGEDGTIYHTYSCYARGLDRFLGSYQFLDVTPKGRDEDELSYTMEWIRHHDRYGNEPVGIGKG